MLSIDYYFLIKAKTIILITVLFAVSTKLLFIVYKLGTHFTQRSAAEPILWHRGQLHH